MDMKFDCGDTVEDRRIRAKRAKEQWHPWFAWRPVRIGAGDCRWLEYVERKVTWVSYDDINSVGDHLHEYRASTTRSESAVQPLPTPARLSTGSLLR